MNVIIVRKLLVDHWGSCMGSEDLSCSNLVMESVMESTWKWQISKLVRESVMESNWKQQVPRSVGK